MNSEPIKPVKAAGEVAAATSRAAADTVGAGATHVVHEATAASGHALASAAQAMGEAADSAGQTMQAAIGAVGTPVSGTPTPHTLAGRTTLNTQRVMEKMMTTAEDFMAFGHGNFEALVKAGQIWATGMQDLGKSVAESAQAQIEHNVNAFKAMTTVKSLREALELQSTHARAAMEKAVADGGKITDASMKLAEQTLAPLTARMSVAAERFGRAA